MASPTENLPPPFEGHERPHIVRISAREGSTISEVNLYASQAEIRRIVRFDAQQGANQVILSQLPSTLEEDSVRVEGNSAITVHEVIMAKTPPVDLDPETSQKLKALQVEEKKLSARLERNRSASTALGHYVSSVTPANLPSSDLGTTFSRFKETAESFYEEEFEVSDRLEKVKDEIASIRAEESNGNRNSEMQATLSLYCEDGGSVAIAFIYSVWKASWTVTYDVRVNMDTKEKPVVLIYKACISQSSGEDWNNVALTLQTAQQSLNVVIPELSSWTLTKYRPPVRFGLKKTRALRGASHIEDGFYGQAPGAPMASSRSSSPTRDRNRTLAVTSKGDISASYGVPGQTSIPSDGAIHKVSIVSLDLGAQLEWIVVPRLNTQVYLKARIQNTSDYTLLPGPSKIYVDGSYIATSNLPLVSPQESFDCPLGHDPTVKVTYTMLPRKSKTSGMMTKTTAHEFGRKILIHNSKLRPITTLRVLDQIPISEENEIVVTLISPPLTTPLSGSGSATMKGDIRSAKVSKNVVAQYAGLDEENDDNVAGKDGKIEWICTGIGAQEKLSLVLEWKVSHPEKLAISHLQSSDQD